MCIGNMACFKFIASILPLHTHTHTHTGGERESAALCREYHNAQQVLQFFYSRYEYQQGKTILHIHRLLCL